MDAENPHYTSENGVLYNKSKTVLVRVPTEYDIANIAIPQTVTVIGEGAFSGCTMGAFMSTMNSDRGVYRVWLHVFSAASLQA